MTATIVDPDTSTIAHLDYATPCDVNQCHHQPDTAQPAIAVLVRTMLCCTERAPVCFSHQVEAAVARLSHSLTICPHHWTARCAHASISFEPLS